MTEALTTKLKGYQITVSDTTIRWEGDFPGEEELPTCFGRIVGMSTRPRPDHDMLVFFEHAVYAMNFVGAPRIFSFTPLICD